MRCHFKSQREGREGSAEIKLAKVNQHFSLFLFSLGGVSDMRRLRMKRRAGPRSHLSASGCAAGHRRSVESLHLWRPPAGSFAWRGTRRGAVAAVFGELFFGGAVVVRRFAAAPLPGPRFPARVVLDAVSVSSSWEADPKRTCSSTSAASEYIDRAPPLPPPLPRLSQESQHSLL